MLNFKNVEKMKSPTLCFGLRVTGCLCVPRALAHLIKVMLLMRLGNRFW